MNFEFMTIDTPLPPCMPFPRALTGFSVSSTAKVMYCRMLDAMQKFVDRMESETVDVKQLGLVGRTKEQILQELVELYALQ